MQWTARLGATKGQPQTGDAAKVAGTADLQHIDAPRPAVRARFEQPQYNPSHDLSAGSGLAGHIAPARIPSTPEHSRRRRPARDGVRRRWIIPCSDIDSVILRRPALRRRPGAAVACQPGGAAGLAD